MILNPYLKPRTLTAGLLSLGLLSSPVQAETPTPEDLWRVIQRQQRQIDDLKRKLDRTHDAVERTEEKVEATGAALDRGAAALPASASWTARTRIGGYGELHYNNLDSRKELDFHRFVLFFGHDFTDRFHFDSEVEIEHVTTGEGAEEKGEVSIEQALLSYDLTARTSLLGGLYLVPVGILNETHEPPTFYGVERNPVETFVIPTTWSEAGGGVRGRAPWGMNYEATVGSGLKTATTGANAYLIRPGRQSASHASADNGAFTGRVRWTAVPGIELATTLQYQTDLTQGKGLPGTGADALLWEAHAIAARGPFALRALYARWDLFGAGPRAAGRDLQYGWYVEPSVRPHPKIGLFARYNEWDNGGTGANTWKWQANAGFNYWPIPNVVLKFDVQRQGGAVQDDGFNAGIGYQF